MRLSIVLALALVACGGRQTSDLDETTDTGTLADASTETATDSATTTDGAPADAPPTADTCAAFVGAVCNDSTKACCEKVGLGWGGDACKTGLDYFCNALVGQVAVGKATYDASKLEACSKGWKDNLAGCQVSWRASGKNLLPCDQLFNGLKAPGETCDPNGVKECHAEPGFGAYCDQTAKKCRTYAFVGAGQPCNFVGSTLRYCDDGLYCDMTTGTSTCKTAKAPGAACDGPDDLSCGYEYVCKDNKCQKGAPEGTACGGNTECASWTCTASKCTATTQPAVSSFICKGS